MSSSMRAARLRWSRTVVGCHSPPRASCHIVSRSATVAPRWDADLPRTSASHAATSALTAFWVPRNVLATCLPSTKTRASHTPDRRSVIVATAARLVPD